MISKGQMEKSENYRKEENCQDLLVIDLLNLLLI